MGGAADACRIVSKLLQPHTSWYCAALRRRHPAAGLRGVVLLWEVVTLVLPAFPVTRIQNTSVVVASCTCDERSRKPAGQTD